MIKVFLAETHTVLRYGLRLILEKDPELMVVGEAITGAEIMSKITLASPDVILMDLHLPDICGVEMIRRLRTFLPKTEILILTTSDRHEDMLAVCKAGAKGYS